MHRALLQATRLASGLLIILLPLTPAHSAEGTVAIVGATVLHPERDGEAAVAPETTVLIVGERIGAVGLARTTPVPADALVIDGRGKWLVPGLTDAHVHFDQSGNLYTRPDIADLTGWMPYAKEQARNRARLAATFRVWLASGVTSVVDVGGPMWTFEVREAARRSDAAPHVAVAGPLVSMIAVPQLDTGDPPIVKVDSPESARAAVERTLRAKPDYIKVWFIHQAGDDLAQQEAIVKAAGDAAHAAGVRLAVHATELEVAKAALRAGANYLVHSVEDEPVDEEFVALARARDVLYCPTLSLYEGYALALTNRWQPSDAERRLGDPQIVAMMRDLDVIPRELVPGWMHRARERNWQGRKPPHAAANLRRLWDAGITVVLGSDAGNIGTLHGPAVFREMERMVQAGLTPLETLRAATTNGAKAMGKPGEAGVIKPGARADLVLIDADPLQSIANLSRIARVIKRGRAYTVDQLLTPVRQ
jgi:imidazolonepropionase-like amidohydrolase